MRLALISDLHANLPALEAVLDELEALLIDRIICLGDICDLGPEPAQTLERVRGLRCAVVQGNHDPFCEEGPPIIQEISAWCARQLDDEQRQFLATLPQDLRLHLPGGRRLLALHGSPRGFNDGFLPGQSNQQRDELLQGASDDIIVGGHTHVQLMVRHREQLLVNAGSVGCPFATPFEGGPPQILPWAEFAIIDATDRGVSVDLRRVNFDVERLIRTIERSTMPNPEAWADQWRHSATQ